MLHVDVSHLVSHYASEFRFVIGRSKRPNVDKHRTARQREGVDLLLRDHVKLERPRNIRRDYGRKFLTQLLDVLRLRA